MIANGRGKGRTAGGGSGGMCEISTWQTVALSTSEEPLHESSHHEGVRGRILSVGGSLPPFPSGMGTLVQSLERGISLNHGYAGEAYIRHLNGWSESDWVIWQRRYVNIRAELLRNCSSNLAGRISGYIAALQLAGEVVCPLIGIPFKPEVLGAWLMFHLTEQQSRQNQVSLALRALADHYVANLSHFAGTEKYDSRKPVSLYGSSKRLEYVGFLRSVIERVFGQRRWGQTSTLNKMSEAGILYATEADRHTKKVSVQGAQHRMVCIKWSALFPGDASSTY